MTQGRVATRPDLSAWHLESIRVTAFPTPDGGGTPETWWKNLFGEEAPIETVQRTRLVFEQKGEALGGTINLLVRPGRLDWGLAPEAPRGQPPESFREVGKVVETAPRFVDLMTRWVPSCPVPRRFALGLSAFVLVPGHREAYMTLDALLPSVEVDPESTDFQYRVNRPRRSRLDLPDLRINRLMTWHALRFELEVVSEGSAQRYRAEPVFACRADLDINTSPDFEGPLPQEKLGDLLHEFLDLSLEILKEGDRP